MNPRKIIMSVTFCFLLFVTVSVHGKAALKQSLDKPSQYGLDSTRLPQNIAVYVGAEVIFICSADASSALSPRIQWSEFASSANGQLITDGDYILPAHPNSDRYGLIRNNTSQYQYDLVISNVNLNDAGLYSCYDANVQNLEKRRAAAQLIVIEGPQNCTTTIPPGGSVMEGHYHTVECTLDYKGNISPYARWQGPQPFNQGQSDNGFRIWNGMSFSVHRTMSQQHWTSRVNFTNNFHPAPIDTAENVPEFLNLYDTERLTVHWAPQNMYASPIKDDYLIGDVLECFADAFPIPSYEWHNLRTGDRYPGSRVTVTQDWEGFEQTLVCTAINTIEGLPYDYEIFIPVNVPGPTTTPTTTTPTTTTLPPPVSDCLNLAGRWESIGPTPAYMCLEVLGENGNVHGVLRNDTETFWIDLVGITDLNTYDHASFTGIWPLNRAVSTFIGECSRCHGQEHLLINAVSRTKGGPPCATPGEINYSLQYDFLRNPSISCPPITIPPNTFEK